MAVSGDEIRAVYVQGEEAVIALAESFVARINALEERVEALENQLKKDSYNSSKPPSSDVFKKKEKGLRTKRDRPSVSQPGHSGCHLEWSDTPTVAENHPVLSCQGSGNSVLNAPVKSWEVLPEMWHSESRPIFVSGKASDSIRRASRSLDHVFDGSATAAEFTDLSITPGWPGPADLAGQKRAIFESECVETALRRVLIQTAGEERLGHSPAPRSGLRPLN